MITASVMKELNFNAVMDRVVDSFLILEKYGSNKIRILPHFAKSYIKI